MRAMKRANAERQLFQLKYLAEREGKKEIGAVD